VRFVYVVSRVDRNLPEAVRQVPVLGTHPSLWRARRHYNSVTAAVHSELTSEKSAWFNEHTSEVKARWAKDERYKLLAEYSSPDTNVRLEKWRLK
jgi:hypothetical protein